jgi:hypothetical protein
MLDSMTHTGSVFKNMKGVVVRMQQKGQYEQEKADPTFALFRIIAFSIWAPRRSHALGEPSCS